jgi:hypothetical protein
MIMAGRPLGFTPWRIVRSQSSGLYATVTPPAVMFGPAMRSAPLSTNMRPPPFAPWQSTHPRDSKRYLPRSSDVLSSTYATARGATPIVRAIRLSAICQPTAATPATTTITAAMPPKVHFIHRFIFSAPSPWGSRDSRHSRAESVRDGGARRSEIGNKVAKSCP